MTDLAACPTTDEILGTLTRVEQLLEQGCTADEACRAIGIPVARYQLWRRAHTRTFLATARQLAAMDGVHAKLLQLLTEQQLEIERLRRLLGMGPSSRSLS